MFIWDALSIDVGLPLPNRTRGLSTFIKVRQTSFIAITFEPYLQYVQYVHRIMLHLLSHRNIYSKDLNICEHLASNQVCHSYFEKVCTALKVRSPSI